MNHQIRNEIRSAVEEEQGSHPSYKITNCDVDRSDFFQKWRRKRGGGQDRRWHSISQWFSSSTPQLNLHWRISTSIYGDCSFSHHDVFLAILLFSICLMRSHLYNGQKRDFLIFFDSGFLKENSWQEMVNQSLLQEVRTFYRTWMRKVVDECSNGIANMMFHGLRQFTEKPLQHGEFVPWASTHCLESCKFTGKAISVPKRLLKTHIHITFNIIQHYFSWSVLILIALLSFKSESVCFP